MTVRLVSSVDQGSAAETPVSRAPQIIASVVDHPSDATVTRVSLVDQDSVSAADCNSVSGAVFSGKQVLELWPNLFRVVDVSEASNSRNVIKFFLRPMSVEVVPSRSLTEAVRDASFVFLPVCATREV